MQVRFARSARKHRVSRASTLYVIEHCGLRFREPSRASSRWLDDRLVYLGDDESGAALEIMTIELENGDLLVIHAMPLRKRYQKQYEEARQWRR